MTAQVTAQWVGDNTDNVRLRFARSPDKPAIVGAERLRQLLEYLPAILTAPHGYSCPVLHTCHHWNSDGRVEIRWGRRWDTAEWSAYWPTDKLVDLLHSAADLRAFLAGPPPAELVEQYRDIYGNRALAAAVSDWAEGSLAGPVARDVLVGLASAPDTTPPSVSDGR